MNVSFCVSWYTHKKNRHISVELVKNVAKSAAAITIDV